MKINIIGGGIIGNSVAYNLSQDSTNEVTVYEIDKGYEESSFARSCGGLRAQYFTKTNVEMSNFSIDFIREKTDIDYTGNGYLMLFGDHQKNDCDASTLLQRSCGASTIAMLPNEVKEKHPYLNTEDLYRGCITLDHSEGWIDPVSLHTWYKNEAQKNGVKWVYEDGTKVDHDDADAVVITAGCWSYKVGKKFGLEIPVVPHKHTVFQVKTSKPIIKELPLVADLITGIYLRPEGDMYIVGYDGNGDLNGTDLEPDYNSWDEVWEHLYHRFPDIFDEAKMVGAWAGYYDQSTIDNNAIIDVRDKFFFATGFTGRGLMHSPAVGLVLSEMVQGKELSFDISSYRLKREKNTEKYVI